MRYLVGSEYVQCAGNAFGRPWQEVRKVVVSQRTRKLRPKEIMARVYRPGPDSTWTDYIGEIPVRTDTLQGRWDEYEVWRVRDAL